MIRRLLLSVLIVTSSGCGLAALIGVTTATVLVKDDKGGASTPRPVAVLTPAATSYDRVPISYILTGQGELDVLVEYSTTGSSGPFFAATEAQGAPSQGSTALSAGASGIPHVFVWNSFADLDPVSVSSSADVVVRIAAFQRTGGTPDPAATRVPFGERALTAPFAVDNRLVATIAGPPSTGGEGVEATAVPILAPEGAIVGSGLDLLVSDTGNARVRTLDAVTNLVTTLAGSSAGFGGDGGPAVAAALLQPRGIARATDGAVLICDAGNHRIRRVDPVTQLISTIAGTGSAGFAGDLGPATAARLSTPSAIVVHPSGAVLVADTGNHCVRAIDGSGIIRVVAGTGVAGATGDGGAATSAQLSSPRGLAVDSGGAVVVCDTGNHAVRRFTLGGSITTIAGALAQPGTAFVGLAATSARLSAPVGVVTIADLVYVSDTGNNRILRFRVDDKVERVAGSPTGVAGFAGDSGPASASLLAQPALLASDGRGGLIVGDSGNNRVRRIDASGLITTVAGSGSPDAQAFGDGELATNAQFKDPSQMALGPDGSIYVADDLGHRVRRFTLGGTISTVAGTGFPGYSGDGGPATDAQLNQPFGVAVDRNGIVFIGENNNAVVRAINKKGIITTVAGGGTGPDGVATETSFGGMDAIYSRPGRDELLISDVVNNNVRRLTYQVDADGNVLNGVIDTICGTGTAGFSGDNGPAIAAELSAPFDLVEDDLGNIYLLDQFAAVVRKFQIGGNITTIAGDPNVCTFGGDGGPATAATLCAFYIAFDRTTGFIYFTDFANNRVRRFQEGGNMETVAGNGESGEAGIGGPATAANLPLNSGVLILPDGSILTGAQGTKRIYRFTPGGNIEVVAGRASSALRGDGGPAVAATVFQPIPAVLPDGTLLIAELNFGRVRRVDPRTGLISTLVGKGILGNSGLGGPLQDAVIDAITGIAVDSAGNVFLGEINQSLVLKLDLARNVVERAVGIGPGSTSGGDGGPALDATLQFPEGLCFSPTTKALYMTDSAAGVVRRIDAVTGIITTVAGGGTQTAEGVQATDALLVGPCAVACDADEFIYVVCRAPDSVVRKFRVDGKISTVAGVLGDSGYNGDNIDAKGALLNNPQGITVDARGYLYVADTSNNRVRRIDPAGFISTVAGTGLNGSGPDGVPATLTRLSGPRQVVIDGRGNLYVGEEFGNRVRRFRQYP